MLIAKAVMLRRSLANLSSERFSTASLTVPRVELETMGITIGESFLPTPFTLTTHPELLSEGVRYERSSVRVRYRVWTPPGICKY